MTTEDSEKRIRELQTKVFVLENKVETLTDDVDNYRLELNIANNKVAYLRGYIHGFSENGFDETII